MTSLKNFFNFFSFNNNSNSSAVNRFSIYNNNSNSNNNLQLSNENLKINKNHWEKNSSRSTCSNCLTSFTILNRKHHCRLCGKIFCFKCLDKIISLDPDLNFKFDGTGIESKVCQSCYNKFSEYVNSKLSEFFQPNPLENENNLNNTHNVHNINADANANVDFNVSNGNGNKNGNINNLNNGKDIQNNAEGISGFKKFKKKNKYQHNLNKGEQQDNYYLFNREENDNLIDRLAGDYSSDSFSNNLARKGADHHSGSNDSDDESDSDYSYEEDYATLYSSDNEDSNNTSGKNTAIINQSNSDVNHNNNYNNYNNYNNTNNYKNPNTNHYNGNNNTNNFNNPNNFNNNNYAYYKKQ
ncbi:FYVE zinc finger domain-containing protein [Ascoidea rubescens DSM 1968]|uniref:FYVE-domain-containing protein n=1 Tax=Ascoidea rubescens DSM 1968 TaxID=1344418 RepID=A0A1D2VS42_9ASCO|nr:FYVE-domain-containing protein [Ascoidea rubescens DSM 1968]ODV64442.1 FYVE-domain-containing protein [Ascoidea rubescens DSM 1968]